MIPINGYIELESLPDVLATAGAGVPRIPEKAKYKGWPAAPYPRTGPVKSLLHLG